MNVTAEKRESRDVVEFADDDWTLEEMILIALRTLDDADSAEFIA